MTEITIRLTCPPTNDLIHRFRNFGEDVWREYREVSRVEISLDQIDRATEMFSITTRKHLDRRVRERVREIAEQHNLGHECQID